MSKVGANLQAGFQGVRENQELLSLRSQVQQLQEELTQARTGMLQDLEKEALDRRMEGLTEQLGQENGVHEIALSLIDRDEYQPRTVFPVSLIKERMESLRRQGQKTPIILIPIENGRYRLFDGELRFRSAQKLEWEMLKAVLLPQEEVTPSEALEGQVVTSIHSQRLHDLDLATALVRLAVHQYPNFVEQEHRIPTWLNTALRRLERERKLAALSEVRLATPEAQQMWLEQAGFKEVEEEQLFAVILKLQLNPLSVNSNVFPLLKLADDLKEVIRTEGLESSKARELNRLSADKLHQPEKATLKIRKATTDKVVQEKLSFSATRTLVNQLLQQYNPQTRSSQEDERFVKAVMAIDIESITDTNILRDLKNALKVKLEEVNGALKK